MKNKSFSKQVARTLLAIINPMSDLKFIYRHALRPVIDKLRRLRPRATVEEKFDGQPLSFQQAIAASGKSWDELMRRYRSSRCFWWLLMVLAGGMAILLLLMLLLAGGHELPLNTLLRAIGIDIILFSAAAVGAVKTAEITWHLWQLTVRRVSVADGGAFTHFWAANDGYRSVIVPFWKGVQK